MPGQKSHGERPKRARKTRARNVHRAVRVRGKGPVSERDQSGKRGRGVRVGRNGQLARQAVAGDRGKLGVRKPGNARQDDREKPVGSRAGRLEESTPKRAKGKGSNSPQDGLAYVFKGGRIVRAVPPEASPTPAVQAGQGLQLDIPLPVQSGVRAWKDRNRVCRCCAEEIPALLPHKEYCPLYVAPRLRETGCEQCDTTDAPHFHDKYILFEAGKELF